MALFRNNPRLTLYTMRVAALLVLLLLPAGKAWSYELPDEAAFLLKSVSNITVTDADGQSQPLYQPGNKRALVICPVYTKCPMACSIITAGLKKAVQKAGGLGDWYTILTLTFDTADTEHDLRKFERRWKMDGQNWKCVRTDPQSLQALLGSMDYHYDYDSVSGQYDHPNVIIVLTPSGRISRYLFGMEPKGRDLRIATLEANQERSKLNTGFFNSIYTRCFSYDAKSGTYKVDWGFILQTMAGLLMVLIVGRILWRVIMT